MLNQSTQNGTRFVVESVNETVSRVAGLRVDDRIRMRPKHLGKRLYHGARPLALPAGLSAIGSSFSAALWQRRADRQGQPCPDAGQAATAMPARSWAQLVISRALSS